MIRARVQCASPISDEEQCEGEIRIVPMEHADHASDAATICEVLKRSLPQATFYRLLCEMLRSAPVMYIGPTDAGKAK